MSKINFFSVSEKGLRKNNEDNVLIIDSDSHLLAIVCDGMGGHEAGEEASFLVIETFKKLFNVEKPQFKDENIKTWFNKGIKDSELAMRSRAKLDYKKIDMGTTMIAALVFKKEKKIIFANVGDSRAYAYNDLLHQVSEDQNLLNYYMKEINLSFEEALKIPGYSNLVSSIGPSKKHEINFTSITWDKDLKYILLTSDGVHDYINKPKLEAILFNSSNTMEEKALKIVKASLANGSQDNLTVAIVELN